MVGMCCKVALVAFIAVLYIAFAGTLQQFEPLPKRVYVPAEGESTRLWTNARREPMFIREWISPESAGPRALIFYFHGMNSHSGELPGAFFFANLSRRNIDVIALDQVGHGRTVASEDDRQVCPAWGNFIEDSISLITETLRDKPRYKEVPYFVFGHSMGGCISLLTGRELIQSGSDSAKNFKGALLLAPAIVQTIAKSWLQVKLFETVLLLGGSYAERLALGPGPNPKGFESREHFETYLTDPYCYTGKIKLGFGYQILNMMGFLEKRLNEITFPFFVMHGDRDSAIPLSSSEMLVRESATPAAEKKLSVYQNALHNPFISNFARCLTETLEWIDGRLQTTSSKSLSPQ